MAKKAFYSFHYIPANLKALQVRQMGVIECNLPASDNDREIVEKDGDDAIRKSIDNELHCKNGACVKCDGNS